MQGRGRVEPNPMVGCVIARGGRVIGEGFHRRFGQAHAEPDALAACARDPRGATAYVTLEPCCHENKKTPPCVPRLIAAGLARVVIGCLDPNPRVSGRGVARLRDAGITVDIPCLEPECRQLIAPYIASTVLHRPYVTIKWARSADGLIAGTGGQRVQISSPPATRAIHGLRARCDAILIGAATALHDDPLLTARDVDDPRPLVRCIIDPHLRTVPTLRLIQTAADAPVFIYHGPAAPDDARLAAVRYPGVRTIATVDLPEILADLHDNGVTHLLVESGRRLAEAFIEAHLADRVWIVRSPAALHLPDAPVALEQPFPSTAERQIGPDLLIEALNPLGDLFFANVPSADFVLAC